MAERELPDEVRRGINRWMAKAAVGTAGYGAVIFASAGTLRWVWGWLLLIVITGMLTANQLILIRRDPELLAEREKGTLDRGVKRWDKWITSLSGGFMLLSWIVGGLDFRFQWSGPASLLIHLCGLLVAVAGFGIFLWAMASNAFFSEGVRIQRERGHAVATGGPYQFLRHPGYAGAISAQLAIPALIGSWWALLPAAALAILFVVRTSLEDALLREELLGYDAYMQHTRFRLVPGLW